MRQKLLIGNWKMNGAKSTLLDLMTGLKSGISSLTADIVVCPPFAYLDFVRTILGQSGIMLGAQTVSHQDNGAYTGEVSATMLNDLGCSYVLVGHSERRQYHHETDDVIAQQFVKAKKQSIIPVLCVGETQKEREAHLTEAVISAQIEAIMAVSDFRAAVIAYEPVWAIGTGLSATSKEVEAVHQFIRAKVSMQQSEVAKKLQILYGGSVKPSNAAEIFAMPNVDGGLIGGASLIATDFLSIGKSLK